jgi:hypothetical protein
MVDEKHFVEMIPVGWRPVSKWPDLVKVASDLDHTHVHWVTNDQAALVREDFGKCFDLAQRMDMMYPEVPGSFTGTVSERLTRSFERLSANLAETREHHGKFMSRIKKMTGYQNWPDLPGDFLEAVANLMEQSLRQLTRDAKKALEGIESLRKDEENDLEG